MKSDGSDSDVSIKVGSQKGRKKRMTKKKTAPKIGKTAKYGRSTDRFLYNSSLKEDHNDHIFSVTFDPFVHPNQNQIFATVAKHGLRIYECKKDRTTPIHVFEDPDKNENFYTTAWGILEEDPILAFAGFHGCIRVLNISKRIICRHLIGHGAAINEVQFHPVHRRLLASASKDLTIKIWNIYSEVQVFICGGLHGHRDEVLSCEFNQSGNLLASCGMDHMIMIWNFDSKVAKLAIKAADVFQLQHSKTPFPTTTLAPIYVTRDIHSNYIDCVRWYGDFIFSKSCEHEIKCWEPDLSKPHEINPSPPVTALMSIPLPSSPNWYVRFGLDRYLQYMAAGNLNGDMYVWDLDAFAKNSKSKPLVLTHGKRTAQCRQCNFSSDGSILVGVFDDSTVWRYDLNPRYKDNQEPAVNGTTNGHTNGQDGHHNSEEAPLKSGASSNGPIKSRAEDQRQHSKTTDAQNDNSLDTSGKDMRSSSQQDSDLPKKEQKEEPMETCSNMDTCSGMPELEPAPTVEDPAVEQPAKKIKMDPDFDKETNG